MEYLNNLKRMKKILIISIVICSILLYAHLSLKESTFLVFQWSKISIIAFVVINMPLMILLKYLTNKK